MPATAHALPNRASAAVEDLPLFARMPDRSAILAAIEELEMLKKLLRARRK
jgi:hypothetical protein